MGHRKCLTCGSKQWHKEPSSGLIACSEGHILQNYRNETTEVQELGPHAMKKRSMKRKSEKKGRQSAADPKLYHGTRGRFHYFVCLQFILRKQIATLIGLWDLPAEFEILCKDVWTLHLSMLPKPVPDEVLQETDRQWKDKDSKVTDGEVDGVQQDEDRPELTKVDKNASFNDDEEDEGGSEDDSELEALMRENSEYSSSSSENETSQNGESDGSTKKKGDQLKRRSRNRSSYETPVNTIAVLVVACWMMRVPVMYRDFIRLIELFELPYLDPLRWLPECLAQHLTKHNIQGLSPRHAPSTLGLHVAASKLCKRLYSEYGIFIPEANAASILWRVTKDMGCTPVMYMMAKRIGIDRCVPLGLHSSLAPGVRRVKGHEPRGHVSDSVPVEVKMMSMLIIVMKMVYGLDGQTRGPKDREDVACGLPGKKEILKGLREMSDDKMCDVGEMGAEEMDEYLGFCEAALLGRAQAGLLDAVFPLRGEGRRAGGKKRGGRRGPLCGGEQTSLFAGEEYKTWDEVAGEEYGAVIGRAGSLLGVGAAYLNGIVRRMDDIT